MNARSDPERRDSGPSAAIGVCFWIALVGGVLLLSASFVPLPPVLLVAAGLLLALSTLVAVALAAREARRSGASSARVLAQGVGGGVRWLAAFLP